MTSVARVGPFLRPSWPRVQESIKQEPIPSDFRGHQELNNREFHSFKCGNTAR